ncbi:MAG: sulfate reduction electron transfer complex DsrMKJOP subunit DsrJ [Candidatus Hydrogenedentota bacterium]|nr:MAG: sulfate reduction electron transfer complex DsrMKJOP subunit DsrJ [Candidatus Hydrogenedentota bacterium]
MHDSGKIITGLIIFLGLVTFPIWRNLASGETPQVPEPKIITEEKECITPTEYMRSSHMALLNDWRDLVVREGNRTYVAFNGKEHEISLSNTCMDCHSNKAEFCDQCHNYVGVKPYCWDCHIEPKESN